MNWFHVTVDEGAAELVVQVWEAAQRAGTDLRGQAVFKRRRSAWSVALFFSPDADGLARIFGAKPCRPPRRRGLERLIGSEFAWAAQAAEVDGDGVRRARSGPCHGAGGELANDSARGDRDASCEAAAAAMDC